MTERRPADPRTIRVLVAEDSLFARSVLVKILETDPHLKVVGVARNGKEAVDLCCRLRPDVVTMDIRMPVMDGFEATKAIMTDCPTPIVVISASVSSDDLKISFNAIQAGALDIIEKPRGNLQSGYERLGVEIVRRVRMVSEIRVFRHIRPRLARPIPWTPPVRESGTVDHIVAIGASTGGPSALLALLQAAPAGFPAPIFITQHISDGFGRGCADWLGRNTVLEVKVAESGERLRPGTVYFTPDRSVLELRGRSEVLVRPQRGRGGPQPIDVMLSSVATAWRERAVAVLLTGMGNDGVEGLRRIKAAGGRTIAQDESTSVVWGMPRAAIEAGVADEVLALEQIPHALLRLLAAPAAPEEAPVRILIAEDSLTQATLMKMALQRKGHEILLARDGIEAIRMAWEQAPDLLVSDVEMPRLKGYQVCRLLRDDPKTAGIPVVFLTSLDQRQDAFWGLKSGANKYITKTGDIGSIAEEIHEFAEAQGTGGGGSGDGGRVSEDADVMERIVQLLDRSLFDSTITSEIQSLVDTLEDLGATVRGVLRILAGVVDFHVAAVHLGGEEESQALVLEIARPVAPAFVEHLRQRVLAETGTPAPLPEEVQVEDPEGLLERPGEHPDRPGSVLVARLETKGRPSGAIAIASAEERAYPERVLRTFELIARQANIVIDYARLYERTKQLSITDGLTKLYNHRFFQDALRRESTRSVRHQTPLSLVILDIDHFKSFNDTYGHQQGDAVLRELARVLRAQVRSLDVVARYGGEEFAVIMPDATAAIALTVAERLRAAVETHPVAGPDGPLSVTISLGVATVPDAAVDSPAEFIAAADRALYRAKERGRNRVEGPE